MERSPVGGESSSCAVSGRRGLPSVRLFTDLDRVEGDDVFPMRVLDEVLTYEVDQIRIVEPYTISSFPHGLFRYMPLEVYLQE